MYGKAIDILEELPLTPETEAMWRSLAQVAFDDYSVFILDFGGPGRFLAGLDSRL